MPDDRGPQRCLEPDVVQQFLAGSLDETRCEEVEAHVDGCDTCRRLVSEAARGTVETAETQAAPLESADTMAEPLESAETVADRPGGARERARPSGRGPAPGTKIDRYVIEERIGEGGMGQVLLADDPELKRKVVIKLLHPHLVDPDDTHGIRSRLQREAQAMAQVSHPNVVPVYDVGAFGDEVFVAMEYVDGLNLAEWLADNRDQPWQSILDVFLSAGRGLVAAHRAGLVHRDFKPHNVLVSKDGQVKVTDFGLARAELPAPKEGARLSRQRKAVTPESLLDSPLTSTGAIIGTPAYMAPEQMASEFVDHRSDQFSYCVALFEGLFGKRPFAGGTSTEIFEAALRGAIEPVDSRSPVPRSIRAAIERGLSADAADRFESMEALLDQLSPRLSRSSRWVGAGLAVAAVAGVAIAFAVTRGSGDERPAGLCQSGGERIAEVWNPARRDRIATAFAAIDLDQAEQAARVVGQRLDSYAEQWAAMHREACEATRVSGEQTEAQMEARMACLSRLSAKLDSLAGVYEKPDASVVERSVDLLQNLNDVGVCADAEALVAMDDLPLDPDARVRALEVWAHVDRAELLMAAQKLDEAHKALVDAVESAEKVGHAPLLADALIALGEAESLRANYSVSEERLHAALQAAEQGGYDVARARAYLLLVDAATGQDKPKDAARWAKYAAATIERTGSDPIASSTLAMRMADIHAMAGQLDEAIAAAKRAAEIRERVLGADNERTAQAVRFVGQVYANKANDFVSALPYYEKALATQVAIYGEVHPEVAVTLGAMAYALERTGKPTEAIEVSKRALAINEEYFGEGSEHLSSGYVGMIQALIALERFDEAMVYAKKGAAIKERALGANHPYYASDLMMVGVVAMKAERFDEAAAVFEEATGIWRKANGADNESYVMFSNALAAARVRQGRYDDALSLLEENLDKVAALQGKDSSLYVDTVTRIGDALTRSGRAAEAVPRLTVAWASRQESGHSASQKAWTAMEYAEALWESKQRTAEAIQLATEAKTLYESAKDVAGVKEASDWLAGKQD